MSILVKAGTGLAAGIVAGALGLAFFPRVEPTALMPRSAVEKPQFVTAPAAAPTVVATRAAAALAIASEAKPAEPVATPKPAAPKPTDVAVAPKPVASKPADVAAAPKPATPKPTDVAATPKPAPEPSSAVIAMASLDPPKPSLGETRSISFAPVASPAPRVQALAPAPKPTSTVAETRATAVAPAPKAATATDASARWSVRGLVALSKGDLSSARLYLIRAAEAGDPRALVALADTYDPAMLAKLGVVVAPGDAQRAKDYLIKAAAAGVVGAKDRMAAIDTDAQNVR